MAYQFVRRFPLLVLCLLLGISNSASAAPDPGFELSGFKVVHFGMSPEEIVALGLSCKDSDFTLGGLDRIECAAQDTVFGFPARVAVYFRRSKVTSVIVTAHNTHPLDLVAKFTAALGRPSSFDAPTGVGNILRYTYWLSNSGTSVLLTRSLDGFGSAPKLELGVMMYSQTVSFRDVEQTAVMLRKKAIQRDPSRDF